MMREGYLSDKHTFLMWKAEIYSFKRHKPVREEKEEPVCLRVLTQGSESILTRQPREISVMANEN